MTTPTVIINIYDLMWYDIDLEPDDPNPFFFKNNPIDYIRNLQNDGWIVYMYGDPINEEMKRTILPQWERPQYLIQKYDEMLIIFGNFVRFVQPNVIPELIKNTSSSSFAILDLDRPFYEGITRYSPIEIFELVDPPINIPPGIIGIVYSGNVERRREIITYLKTIVPEKIILGFSGLFDERLDETREFEIEQPIFLIWSPVYRYTKDEQFRFPKLFDRPDVYPIINQTLYIWGY